MRGLYNEGTVQGGDYTMKELYSEGTDSEGVVQ